MAGIVGRVMDRRRIGKADTEKYDGAENDGENTGLESFVDGDTCRGRCCGIDLHLLFSVAISPDSLEFLEQPALM